MAIHHRRTEVVLFNPLTGRILGGGYTFPNGIYQEVNVMVWLGFELTYYDSAVQRFNHYTTRTAPVMKFLKMFLSTQSCWILDSDGVLLRWVTIPQLKRILGVQEKKKGTID